MYSTCTFESTFVPWRYNVVRKYFIFRSKIDTFVLSKVRKYFRTAIKLSDYVRVRLYVYVYTVHSYTILDVYSCTRTRTVRVVVYCACSRVLYVYCTSIWYKKTEHKKPIRATCKHVRRYESTKICDLNTCTSTVVLYTTTRVLRKYLVHIYIVYFISYESTKVLSYEWRYEIKYESTSVRKYLYFRSIQ